MPKDEVLNELINTSQWNNFFAGLSIEQEKDCLSLFAKKYPRNKYIKLLYSDKKLCSKTY